MKILIISGSYSPDKCGVGDYANNLYKKLVQVESNHKIDVLTSKFIYTQDGKKTSVSIDWKLRTILKVFKHIRKGHYDAIHLQFPTKAYRKSFSIIVLMMMLKIHHKIILTLHEFSDSCILAKLRTIPLVFIADKIIVVDSRYKSEIVNISKKFEKKIKTIEIAANIPKNSLDTNIKFEQYKLKYNLNADELVLGYFGFVNKTKGLEKIFNLCTELYKLNIKYKFILIGEFDLNDKYQKSILETIKNDSNYKSNVIITGYLSDIEVANSLYICDYVIFPFVNGLSTKNGSFLAALNQNVKIITTFPKDKFNKEMKNVYYIKRDEKTINIINIIKSTMHIKPYEENIVNSWDDISEENLKVYNEIKSKGD